MFLKFVVSQNQIYCDGRGRKRAHIFRFHSFFLDSFHFSSSFYTFLWKSHCDEVGLFS